MISTVLKVIAVAVCLHFSSGQDEQYRPIPPIAYGIPDLPQESVGGELPPAYETLILPPPVLTLENINPHCKPAVDITQLDAVFAATQWELVNGSPKPTFDKIIDLGMKNPHAQGQKPLTALRQLLAAMILPEVATNLPADIKDRAKIQLLPKFPGGSIGSLTDPRGLKEIRDHVADYFWTRDGVLANVSKIFLSNGASEALNDILSLVTNIIDGRRSGILLPSPDIYSNINAAQCADLCITSVTLDESAGWTIGRPALEAAIEEQQRYCEPRIILLTNPAIPTGHVYTKDELIEVIKFAGENRLLLISDEAYDESIADPSIKFVSVRSVAAELGPPHSNLEIVTIIAATGGVIGEAGLRGGAYELLNVDDDVVASLLETVNSRKLCPNTPGQITMEFKSNPPKKGDASYGKFDKERAVIQLLLKKNAQILVEKLNGIAGVSISPIQGGYFGFATIDLPPLFIKEAAIQGLTGDILFTQVLLRRWGVITLPGTWFNEASGSNHIRINILAPTKDLRLAIQRIEEAVEKIWEEYAEPPTTLAPVYTTPPY